MIDLWNAATLPDVAQRLLDEAEALIRNHFHRDAEINKLRSESTSLLDASPDNEFEFGLWSLKNSLATTLQHESIRTFHYSRMTDSEVSTMLAQGVVPSSKEWFRNRLADLVASGLLIQPQADEIFEASVLHTEDYGEREGWFWACGLPTETSDDGVAPFLRTWGGEIARWTLGERLNQLPLHEIGRPRILEVCMPIAVARQGYALSTIVERIINARAFDPGIPEYFPGIDLYLLNQTLPPEAILHMHTEGDQDFDRIGTSYPESYRHRTYPNR